MKKNLTRILSLLLVLVLMVGVLPVSALADGWDLTGELDTEQLLERAEPVEMQASASDFSKILHLDCGRKYFTKDWIIALLYEMQAAGYNQLQLAFGNDGLRFLLNDMSFTANGKSYSHDTVVSKVEAGNRAQNSSNDSSWLTEAEMDAIIAKATELGIEIVPLLNLPGHANALLDIADDTYNATGSNNTLNVVSADDSARNFGMAIFKKYVDYFHSKGCNYFNFGADEYANDASGLFSFSRLTEQEYARFASFINSLAAYIVSNGMTPRAFNDGLYYNKSNPWDMNTSKNTSIKSIQCCYWSSGWGSYPVATASQIASKSHSMINTHGDFYYVLGKSDNFDSGYSYASGFNNTAFAGKETISNPVGSMFCIWCDYPNAETETLVAQKTRLVLRAMAARMDNKSIDTINTAVVENGFNEDGTLNNAGTEFKIVDCDGGSTPTLEVGKALTLCIANGVSAEWSASPADIVQIEVSDSANANGSVSGSSVKVTALQAGNVTITATNPADPTQTANFTLTVSDPDAPRTETVTLTVGQEVTRTQDGDLRGTYTPDPAGVASVNVTAEPVAGETTYAPVTSLTAGTFYVSTKANDNTPTVTLTLEDAGNGQYYLKDSSGQYIYPSATRNVGYWDYTLGTGKKAVDVAVNNGKVTISRQCSDTTILGKPVTTTAYLTLNGARFGAIGNSTNLYLYTEKTQPAGWKPTITFKGLAVGNTTVKIGDVTYNITVTEKTLETVTPLSVEYWITNARTTGSDGKTSASIAATTGTVASAAGHDAADLLPKTTKKEERDLDYWHSRLLDKTQKNGSTSGTAEQTEQNGDDETNSGVAFTKIRYFDGVWSVFTANNEWVTVESNHQLVAYYAEHIKVTDEVDSHASDWGKLGDGSPSTAYLDPRYVNTLSFQVVYEDSTTNPVDTTAANLRSKTICYGYWENGRGIGSVILDETENFEIYKVTAQTGSMTGSSSGNNQPYTISSFSWEKNEESVWENNGEADWAGTYNNGQVVVYNNARNPKRSGVYQNLHWSTNKEAILLRIYVRAKVTEDSLTVRYVDNANNEEFYHYSIAVASNTTFDPDFALSGNQNQLIHNTVKNIKGITQTVTADLGNLTEIAAQYRHSKYKCTNAVLSDGNKTVTLYYTFTNIVNFVIDFGLPITITPADVSETLTQHGVTLESITVTGVNDGTVTIEKNSKTFTYTPNANFLKHDGEKLTVTYTGSLLTEDGKKNSAVSYQVYIFPASNVLYEENFLTPYAKDPANLPAWTSDTSSQLTGQSQSMHKNDTSVRYGYDDVYQSITGRNGAWTIQGLNAENNVSQALYTEFYGNALDVIGSCGRNTAQVMFLIYNQTTKQAKSVLIDTRYNGTTLEQVPYSHIELPGGDAHYNVMIRAYYAPAIAASNTNTATTFGAVSGISDFALSGNYADQAVWDQMARDLASFGLTLDDVEFIRFADTPAAQTDALAVYADLYSVNEDGREAGTELAIDAFRVYRSASTIHTVPKNYLESEQNIEYWNILDLVDGKIVKAYTENGTVENVTVEAYEANGGPLDEIYLENGQSVAFKVENAGATIQVSLRAVQGATNWADTTTGGTPTRISTNTEMYYTITKDSSGNFVIANRGDALLAVGNVKLPSNAKTTSTSEIDEDALRASVCAALGLSAEQPQAFQPKTFTARATTLPMLRNKRVSVLITISNDVSYVTVNGVKYTPSRYYASWQKTRLIQFGETLGKYESKTYTIIAYDANGVASAPITVNG